MKHEERTPADFNVVMFFSQKKKKENLVKSSNLMLITYLPPIIRRFLSLCFLLLHLSPYTSFLSLMQAVFNIYIHWHIN